MAVAPCSADERGEGGKARETSYNNGVCSVRRHPTWRVTVPDCSGQCSPGSRAGRNGPHLTQPEETTTTTASAEYVSDVPSVCLLSYLAVWPLQLLLSGCCVHCVQPHISSNSLLDNDSGTSVPCKTRSIPQRLGIDNLTTANSVHCHVGLRLELVSFVHLVLTVILSISLLPPAVHSAPLPSFLSSSSSASSQTLSRPVTRFQLAPGRQLRDTIYIDFSPPSILNLRLNTRQNVYFNFSLQSRQHVQALLDIPDNSSRLDVNRTSNTSTVWARVQTTLPPVTSTTTTTDLNRTHSLHSRTPALPTTLLTPWSSRQQLATPGHAERQLAELGSSIYWVMIYSNDDSIARPVILAPSGQTVVQTDAQGSYILMAVWAGRLHNFSVEARHIGRVAMSVAVVDARGDRRIPQSNHLQAVAASQYLVTTIRGERTADLVFNIAAAAIAIIISFGIGAVTDTDSLKRQFKCPVPLLVGFCCQFVLMPVISFALAMMLPLDNEILFGLLCVACVPGGGISHVAVFIADGDTALSLTMNLINAVALLGTAPLWIFVLGQYFQPDPQTVISPRSIPIHSLELWFAAIFLSYSAGLAIKRVRPLVADAILMWMIKPFLLLACILYVTLGVYINMYVFELVNGYALLGAMLLPACGCVMGAVLAMICRQNVACIKTIALETSSHNCLIVMVALRFSLKQPDADLAAVIPIWVMFTIPGLYVLLAICSKFKQIILHFWNNRNAKETDVMSSSKAYSISSSLVSPPGTTTLSAPLVTADIEDDVTVSTTSNQRVTVL